MTLQFWYIEWTLQKTKTLLVWLPNPKKKSLKTAETNNRKNKPRIKIFRLGQHTLAFDLNSYKRFDLVWIIWIKKVAKEFFTWEKHIALHSITQQLMSKPTPYFRNFLIFIRMLNILKYFFRMKNCSSFQ
jgi:hypothetical protein